MSIVLSKIIIFKMPFGGSISFGRIIPLAILSHNQGILSGISACLLYSFINVFLGFKIFPTQNLISYIFVIFLDYILPYIFLGIIFGIKFSDKINLKTNYYIRTTIFFIFKIIFSTISGAIFWNDYLFFLNNIYIYSFLYNLIYILPELFVTIVTFDNIVSHLT